MQQSAADYPLHKDRLCLHIRLLARKEQSLSLLFHLVSSINWDSINLLLDFVPMA